jgi:hypothetical protein
MSVPRDLPREYARALRKCTPTQRKWLRELQRNGFRPWKAAKAIGSGEGAVTRWRRMAHIQAVLGLMDEMATAEHLVTQSFIVGQYKAIAGSNLKDFETESGEQIPLHQLPDEVAAAIAERTVDANGRVKIKLHPKAPALDALANLKNLAPKRLEVTGKDGAPLMPEVQPNEVEIARRLAFLLSKGLAVEA